MTIATLEVLGDRAYPALVVCPNSMKATWAQEFARWAPGRHAVVVEGSKKKRLEAFAEPADVYILNWEGLRGHSRCAGYGSLKLSEKEKKDGELNQLPLRTVVADEAHRAKNPKSQQTRAAWAVAWGCEFRFALTGTPIANSPEDLWSIMHMVEPGEWPSKTKWLDRYGLLSWNPFGGMDVVGLKGETRDELFKYLDPRFIRRPTRVVIPALIEKLPPQRRTIGLAPKQAKAYHQLQKEMLAELDSGVLMASNPLARMARLMQLAAAYGEVDQDGGFILSEPSSKLDALEDIVEELGGEPAVVFAESRQLIELASRRLQKLKIKHGLITGSVSTADRQGYVEQFQAGELPVMLATLGAGGEGITLTASRFPVFLQRSFSLVKNLQAEDRTWRKGQEGEVQRIDVVAGGTIDEHVLDVGEEKAAKLEEVCRDEDTVRRWLET